MVLQTFFSFSANLLCFKMYKRKTRNNLDFGVFCVLYSVESWTLKYIYIVLRQIKLQKMACIFYVQFFPKVNSFAYKWSQFQWPTEIQTWEEDENAPCNTFGEAKRVDAYSWSTPILLCTWCPTSPNRFVVQVFFGTWWNWKFSIHFLYVSLVGYEISLMLV